MGEEGGPRGLGPRVHSPVGVEGGQDQAPRPPAAAAQPPHAVGASLLPSGCNTLLPVASAGGEIKITVVKGRPRKLAPRGPLPTADA